MHLHLIMGVGPWYRIGLSLSNALILVAIIETILTWNAASHSLAEVVAFHYYGRPSRAPEPGQLVDEMKEHPKLSLYGFVLIFHIFANVLLWVAVIVKGNKQVASLWVMSAIMKTSYTAMLEMLLEWGRTYQPLEALQKVSAFLWGTLLFGFCIITGVQAAFYLSTDDGRSKVSPVGQGRSVLMDYYREHFPQLAVVLLLSEIATNIHRCFHYPTTAFLLEADNILNYSNDPPSEYGLIFSTTIIVFDAIGLILLATKKAAPLRIWAAIYVIITLINLIIFAYIAYHWSSLDIYASMLHAFFIVSVVHIIYKLGILYVYFKSSRVLIVTSRTSSVSNPSQRANSQQRSVRDQSV